MRVTLIRALPVVAVILFAAGHACARDALTDSTDVKVRNSSGVDALGSENSVFIHPSDSKIVLVTQNNHAVGASGGADGWVSQDGGKTWTGDNTSVGGGGIGDPAAVIRRSSGSSPARYLVGQIGAGEVKLGQVVMYKDNATSLTWTPATVVTNALGDTDKNHLWVDNHPSSTWTRRLYAAWTNLGDNQVESMYSDDGGISWLGRAPVSAAGTKSEWGVNLVVGIAPSIRGRVYAAWGETVNHQAISEVASLYFNRSVNGAETWSSPTLIRSLGGRGYAKVQNELGDGKDMGTTSAPNLATDAAGNLYVVWTQKQIDGSGAEVYIMKSTNEGSTWTALGSEPKRVSSTSTSDQWHSWVTYDDCTDAIVVVCFDSRTEPGKAETYIAVSYDGGSNFQDVKVSDTSWDGDDGLRDAGE